MKKNAKRINLLIDGKYSRVCLRTRPTLESVGVADSDYPFGESVMDYTVSIYPDRLGNMPCPEGYESLEEMEDSRASYVRSINRGRARRAAAVRELLTVVINRFHELGYSVNLYKEGRALSTNFIADVSREDVGGAVDAGLAALKLLRRKGGAA
ncbi:hypothetical protein [Microcystis phage Mae-JY24]